MWAIVGGSGLYELPFLENVSRQSRETPWGETTGIPLSGTVDGRRVLFLNRHGPDHATPPHLVNYRANLWKLHALGASRVLAIGAVGGIERTLAVDDLVLPHQLIDYTWGREGTYHVGGQFGVAHVDFTHPFDDELQNAIQQAADRARIKVMRGGVCAVTQGPRLETAAEIDRLERDGAALVSMTALPEAALARELNLPYVLLAGVVNPAAGRGNVAIHQGLDVAIRRFATRVSLLLRELLGSPA